MKLINIGFGNMVSANRLIAIVSPESAPIKRIVQEARDKGALIDATYGRRTRAVIITDSDHVILSAVQPETVANRLNDEDDEANKQRYLLVVSGPSGAGKDTVVSRMMQKHPEIEISVSATTRAPRAGETDGENYYFLTNEQFEEKIDRGEMLEYVNYCGKYYGTPKSEVDARLDRGTTVVLVIEVVGAANIKKLYPESTLIFIMPPSMDELRARLRGRGTESEEAIAGRLKRAEEELPYAREYDFSVENRDVDACADEIRILKQRQQD